MEVQTVKNRKQYTGEEKIAIVGWPAGPARSGPGGERQWEEK